MEIIGTRLWYICGIEDERLGLQAATAASMISHVSIMKVAGREAEKG